MLTVMMTSYQRVVKKTLRHLNGSRKILGLGLALFCLASYLYVNQLCVTSINGPVASSRSITSRGTKRLPQAIIIGCRKSGTRALLRFLEINPTVRAARKEVHYFDRPQNYKLGLDWYRDQMPLSEAGQLTIEKSPAYFVTNHVAERVHRMNSSIKLIVIFRDPITRLVSDFSQLVANRHASQNKKEYYPGRLDEDYSQEEDFSLEWNSNSTNSSVNSYWLKAEQELDEYIFRSDGGVDDQKRAIRIGMYSNYLEKWLSLFGREQMHFVDGEKLISDPFIELTKLERFLDLMPFIKKEHFVFSPKKGFFCLNGTALIQADYKSANRNSREIHCLSRSKGRRHLRLKKSSEDKLRNFYEPYSQYLNSLTGINFNT